VSSEEKGFLNRWSRRKQEAAKEPLEAESAKSEQQATESTESEAAKSPEEEFDISKLPPIGSITAATDIRAFLSKGVPAALTQAALRRAWSADPAIRDHIGLSEYSWDFNSPGQYGFGPLDSSVNVKEMVADVFGKVKKAAAETEALAEKADPSPAQTESARAQNEPPHSVELRSEQDSADARESPTDLPNEIETGDKTAEVTAAPQQPAPENDPAPSIARRHGSALPS
jgi:hypothetical protein